MTPSIRLHVATPLHEGARVTVTPEQAHYLGAVMRRGRGDTLRLFNGCNGEFLAAITALNKRGAELEVRTLLRPQMDEPDLWLAFAPIRRDATELVVQKATELGVSALLPVLTERTQPARLNLPRLAAIATEAAEQSERLTLPRLDPPQTLANLLDTWQPPRVLVAGFEREAHVPIRPVQGPAALLIGPEGGFRDAELDALRKRAFVVPATLGPRLLRAETAAIVGLALLQARSGGQVPTPQA